MINQAQIDEIKKHLVSHQLSDKELIDDLLDHLSCEIESLIITQGLSFDQAFAIAKDKVLPKDPFQVQQDLIHLTSKTPNIMFKKLAYIGAYVSTLCLLIAIALFTVSSLNDRKIELAQYQQQKEYEKAVIADATESFKIWSLYLVDEKSQSYNQLMQSQAFFLVSLLIFAITFLPYRFYAHFQRAESAAQYA